ncbi:MAG: tRNA lysidine(34) synthetase TilS [Pseudomonadota bacterium]
MTSISSNRLSPDELFKGLNPKGIVLVAVSGGGDSVALLLLAHAWANKKDITLHAVTVDHGLRPEAAAEAAFVASICDGLNVDHTTLGWEGIKPHSGLADAARKARYALMEEFALEIGSDLILSGHTADDQAETVHMRMLRDRSVSGSWDSNEDEPEDDGLLQLSGVRSSGRGLSGMARHSLLPGGCELVRPLLEVSREELRAYLGGFPQNWIEDPTNWDMSFERARIRNQLANDPMLTERLLAFSKVMGGLRAVVSRDTAQLLGATVKLQPGSVFVFDDQIAMKAPEQVLVHAFQMLIAVSGGGEYLVSRSKIGTVLERVLAQDFGRTNLGGSIIERKGEKLRFYREMRSIPSTIVEPGERLVWDGRLEVFNGGRDPVAVGPLTRRGLNEVEQSRGSQIPGKPRAALLSTASIRMGNRNVWLPMIEREPGSGEVVTRLTARAVEQFCPETDFAMLDWLQGLDVARNASLQSRI